jgi:sarcosine dehydrogenase
MYIFPMSIVFQIRAEVEACRRGVCVFDTSYFGKYFLTGRDATIAAQYLFTNQMLRPPGTVIYTCFLNERGGTEADLTVTVLDQEHRLPGDPPFKVSPAHS